MVNTLEPISLFALSLIGFMIGGELKLSQLKKYGKQIALSLIKRRGTVYKKEEQK